QQNLRTGPEKVGTALAVPRGLTCQHVAWRDGDRRGRLEIQDAGDKIAHGDSQLAPQAPLEAAVVLHATEKITHQLTKDGAAAEELDHARGHSASEKLAAIESADNPRGKLEVA